MDDPNVRCRLVAQEFAKGEERDDLFAGTPPLYVMKMLLSDVASNRAEAKCIMVLDAKCAFLYGSTPRDIYIELPDEDPMSADKDYVGKLLKAMYGTRDAPAVWQEEVRKLLVANGFTQSRINPCVFSMHCENQESMSKFICVW